MAKNNDNNGYTIKEMLGMMMSQTKENDQKRVDENKRIYDKMDDICIHNSEQDALILKNTEHIKDLKENKKGKKSWFGSLIKVGS